MDRARADGVRLRADIYPYLAGSANLSQLLAGLGARGRHGGHGRAPAYASRPRAHPPASGRPPWCSAGKTCWSAGFAPVATHAWSASASRTSPAERHAGSRCDGARPDRRRRWPRQHDRLRPLGCRPRDGPASPGHPHRLGRAGRRSRTVRAAAAIRTRATTAAIRVCSVATCASSGRCRWRPRSIAQPAWWPSTFGLRDRGVLEVGRAADVVVFDPALVLDEATFLEPQRFPTGIETVVVNGTLVVEHGEAHQRATWPRPPRRRMSA